MTSINRAIRFITGHPDVFTRKQLLFNAILFLGAMPAIIFLLIELLFVRVSAANLTLLSSIIVVLTITYISSRVYGYYNLYVQFGYVVFTQVVLSLMWFNRQGSFGTVPYAFVMAMIFFIMILDRKYHLYIIGISFANLILLYFVEAYHPEWVTGFGDDSILRSHLIGSQVFMLLFSGAAIYWITTSLNQTNKLKDGVVDNVDLGIISMFGDGTINLINPMALQLFGKQDKRQATDQGLQVKIVNEDYPLVALKLGHKVKNGDLVSLGVLAKSIATADISEMEFAIVRGKITVPVKIQVSIYDGTSKDKVYILMIKDQSGEKAIFNRFKMLFDLSPLPYALLSNESTLDCNNAALELFGFNSKAQFISQSYEDFSPKYQSDGRVSETLRQAHMQDVSKDGFASFKWIHKRWDGSFFPAEVVIRKIVMEDQVGYLLCWIDLSKLQEQQKEIVLYEKFFSLTLELLCVAGTNGYFKQVNPAFSQLLGYTETELLEAPFTDFIHPEDLDITYAEMEKLSKGSNTMHFQNRYRKKDGTFCWLDWKATLDEESGELFAAAHDVTDIKSTRAELEQSNDDLNQINSALDSFVYSVSHDLKLPVLNFKNMLKMLREVGSTDLALQDTIVQKLENNSVRMEQSINDLLEISRLKAHEQLPYDKVMVSDVFNEILLDIESIWSAKNAKCTIVPEGAELFYPTSSLKTILSNLISNSLKYHKPDKSPEITITVKETELAYQLTFEDKGKGIDLDLMGDKLFKMFSRLDTLSDGTGVGLYIVDRLLQQQGDTVVVNSKVNKGTKFILTLNKHD